MSAHSAATGLSSIGFAAPPAAAQLHWLPVTRVSLRDRSAISAAINSEQPLIVTDLAADWPALQRWTPDKLAEKYGSHQVPVYDASFGAPGRNYMGSIDDISLSDFLTATQVEGRDLRLFLYNLSQQIPELLDDIQLPDLDLHFSKRFVFSFFGCPGSTTPLHFDIDMGCVFHTVIRGRRRVRLFAPSDSALLYQHPYTVRSYLNLDAPDFERNPALLQAQGYEVTLEPGETLLMPPGWWHEFHYLDAGIGVSLRAAPLRWRHRLQGAINLLLKMPIDRLANRIAPDRWYAWKERYARSTANRCAHKSAIRAPGATPS